MAETPYGKAILLPPPVIPDVNTGSLSNTLDQVRGIMPDFEGQIA